MMTDHFLAKVLHDVMSSVALPGSFLVTMLQESRAESKRGLRNRGVGPSRQCCELYGATGEFGVRK